MKSKNKDRDITFPNFELIYKAMTPNTVWQYHKRHKQNRRDTKVNLHWTMVPRKIEYFCANMLKINPGT